MMNNVKRGFSGKLLDTYDWLEWSEENNKMYCFPCYLMNSPLKG